LVTPRSRTASPVIPVSRAEDAAVAVIRQFFGRRSSPTVLLTKRSV